jgi:hypothetical protein
MSIPTGKPAQQANDDAELDSLVPDAQVCIELGGISKMTLNRRDNYDPDFPSLIKVNGRNFRSRRQLEAYKARLLHEAARQKDKRITLRRREPTPVSR